MPIDLVNVLRAKGRVVHFKLRNREEELDELVDVESYGGVLHLRRGGAALMSHLEFFSVVTAKDVAQLFADRNAAAGLEHSDVELYPSAGTLAALFPGELKDEHEAVQLILSSSPAQKIDS